LKRVILFLTIVPLVSTQLYAQIEHRDKAIFVEPKNEFWDSIKTTLDDFYSKNSIAKKEIRPDFSQFNPPKSIDEFKRYWHNKPVSQARSGMCWCFSTTSFLESEIYRLSKHEIKLSEIYTVYWEYIEKAMGYVRSLGNQEFGEGSQANAVFRVWKNHGIVPANAYTGLLNDQPFHDYSKMFTELNNYLKSLTTSHEWEKEKVEKTIRATLNYYIGEPPEKVTVDGKLINPKEYFEKNVRLNLDDYVSIVSFMDRPYYTWIEYNVPDNWWHSKEYFNVPLDEYMTALKKAVHSGYTVELWGDVSEPGIDGHAGIAVVPTFDIPPQYIDESARIFRFKNGTTGDDHGIHVVGYMEKDGKDWYLIKDSGSGSRNNLHPGYFFFQEDYVKLKMLGFMVHKSAIPEIIAKMK
jgi:bleomycin hydrolase